MIKERYVCPHCGSDKGATRSGYAVVHENIVATFKFTEDGFKEVDRDYGDSETQDDEFDGPFECLSCGDNIDESISESTFLEKELEEKDQECYHVDCNVREQSSDGEGWTDRDGDWWCEAHIENGKNLESDLRRYDEDDDAAEVKLPLNVSKIVVLEVDGSESAWKHPSFGHASTEKELGGAYAWCGLTMPDSRKEIYFNVAYEKEDDRNAVATQLVKMFSDGRGNGSGLEVYGKAVLVSFIK